MDSEVTNSLCASRMETIDVKLTMILEKIDKNIVRLEHVQECIDKIPDHEKRITSLEVFRSNFTFVKLITAVATTTTAILVIYEAIRRLIF